MIHSAFLPRSTPFAGPTLALRCAIALASGVIGLGLCGGVLGLFNSSATKPMLPSTCTEASSGSESAVQSRQGGACDLSRPPMS
jgi:hypothetical protein